MALKRADFICEGQLEQFMLKVAAVCIHTSPEPLPESKDGLIDWTLRQIGPDDFEYGLEFRLVLGFGLVGPILFKHCPPDVIVKRVEIWRVRRPFVFGDEVWSVLLQPFLRLTSGVSGRTVLLEDEGGGSYIVAVLDQSTSLATCRVLLLVPGSLSCEQIRSSTLAMFSAVRADFGLPLPAFLSTADPLSSIRLQMACSFVCFQSFSG